MIYVGNHVWLELMVLVLPVDCWIGGDVVNGDGVDGDCPWW